MKPQFAAVRQQQTQRRREQMEEAALRAQAAMRAQGRAPMRGLPSLVQEQYQNRLISEKEWDELVAQHSDSGRSFRNWFLIGLAVVLLMMFLLKYDEEYGVEVPQVVSGKGFGQITGNGGLGELSAEELDSYYRTLGIENPAKRATEDTSAADGAEAARLAAARADPDKERRRENYRVRQQLKAAMRHHHEEQGQLVHCGRACEAHNQQVELAYSRLSSQVDRELFGVLLDAPDTKAKRSTTPKMLKQKFEEKKKLIEETEKDPEDRQMALEELQDAYDILQDPDARKYYLLYGYKPPERMRHISARDGGWGQSMTLGTYKYRIIIMWLDYLQQYIGTTGELCILLGVVVLLLCRIPNVVAQFKRVLDDLEWSEEVEQQEREKAERERAAKAATATGAPAPAAAAAA